MDCVNLHIDVLRRKCISVYQRRGIVSVFYYCLSIAGQNIANPVAMIFCHISKISRLLAVLVLHVVSI
jgi:hypothetical protein